DPDSEVPVKRSKIFDSDDEFEDETEQEEGKETGEEVGDKDEGSGVEEYSGCSPGRWMDRELSSEGEDSDFVDDPPKPELPKDGPATKSKELLTLQKGSDAFAKQAASLLNWLEDEDASSSKLNRKDANNKQNQKKDKTGGTGSIFQSESNVVTISDEDTDEEEGI
ncbi:polyprotein, partial [Frankliniella fusca]